MWIYLKNHEIIRNNLNSEDLLADAGIYIVHGYNSINPKNFFQNYGESE